MSREANLRDVIASWQTKLLQLDRRNSLLYFRGDSSSVRVTGMSPDELLERLQRSRIGLKFTYAEQRRRARGLEEPDQKIGERVIPGDLETDLAPLPLQRRLLNLHRRDREWEEEQGVNVLHLALGFLDWVDEDGVQAKAPLLLASADLERDSPGDPWRLKLDHDDLQINETLRHQLKTFGLLLPDFDHDSPSAYLEEVSRAVIHKQGWAVDPAIALATFPFAKMAMWEDLEQMRLQGIEHPVILALAIDPQALRPPRDAAPPKIPEGRELSGGGLDDLLPVKRQFTVLEADHSQLRAVELARRGIHLVIDGPPGTGKSQTIANIVGTLLADGKRVLFVSEKTAALDVVKKRLEDSELGSFCLDLHSHRARKPSVYQQLREALDAPRTGGDHFPYERLEEQRERLNAVARALHEIRNPLGLSVYQVHGRFARVRSLPRVDFPLGPIDRLTAMALLEIQEATARIARRGAEFEAHRMSPWRALRHTRTHMELADELRQKAGAMSAALSGLRSKADAACKRLGLPLPARAGEVEGAGRIAAHMTGCPGVPEAWLNRDALQRLDRRAADLATLQSDRLQLQEKLAPFFGAELPSLDFDALRSALTLPFDDKQRLRNALGPGWSERLCPVPETCERELTAAVDCTRRLRECARSVAGLLMGEPRTEKLSQIRQVARMVRSALDNPVVPASWLEPDGISSARARLEKARSQLAILETAERRLFEEFEETLLEHVSQEMLVRYRTDYQSVWRFLRKSYRSDRRTLRGCLRRPRQLGVQEALAAVQSALEVRRLREAWEAESAACAAALGAQFSGRNTDWEALLARIETVGSWTQGWSWGLESARLCFSAPEIRAALEPLVQNLEAALVHWDQSPLASQEAAPDLDLAGRQIAQEQGAAIIARLVRDGASLWPHLHGNVTGWSQLADVLHQAVQLRKSQAQEEELAPALRQDFERYYDGPETDWQKARAALHWTRELLDLVGGRVPAGLTAQCRSPLPAESYAAQQEQLAAELGSFRAQTAAFSGTFDPQQVGWADWEAPSFDQLASWLVWMEGHADSASSWLEYRKAVQDLEGLLAPGAVSALREATDDATQVPDLVLRRIYAAWIDFIADEDARLRFQPRDHENLRAEFQKLDRRFLDANRARIRERCFRGYPDDSGSAIEWGQMGILNRQLSLKRKQLPVRRLIQQIPQLLKALKPCFLMSPVAVSQYLSRTGLATDSLSFDTVIFDEASQVFPHDAVPAIARAAQVIVVGDEKQLPPSSFFRSIQTEDDEDEEETEDRLEGAESILDVMIGMTGAGVHRTHLDVHYRSRHEELIRYSNHHFYRDRLLTFPSPESAAGNLGLKDVFLPDARYDAGATRTNLLEAEAAVDHVFELLGGSEDSVGVVTLSRAQANRVEELINRRRLEDPSLDRRFAEDLHERFFVKNLENVQGDERDHIILSIGYGPTVGSGSVPNRFGPINAQGGERRLNVAVTRARKSLTVIRSLRPEQITSETEGSRLLRRFLEYVQDPQRAFERVIDANPAAEAESPFEEEVYRALTERGHGVAKQVGCFGYRIDLAITSEDGSRYDLGIECDGAAYHRAPAARDRDWLRQQVLEGLDWTIHRIWSTDWINDPQGQIRAVERALEAARARPRRAASDAIRKTADSVGKGMKPPKPVDGEDWLSRSAAEFQFAPYQPTVLPRNRSTASIEKENSQTLRNLVTTIVEAEGPVHLDVVIDRIRRHYGAGRAGSQIQAAILQAAQSAATENGISWIQPNGSRWPPSFLDVSKRSSRPEPRGPAADGSVRQIEHVWPGEIEAGLLRIIETAFGICREDAVVAAARAFGYQRVGTKIREAISAAVDSLLTAGEIAETPAGLTKPAQPTR